MKRIAIVASSFSGATLPLARHLLNDGFSVDYYIISGRIVELIEGISFKSFIAKKFLGEVDKEYCVGLYSYLDSPRFHLYYHKRPRPFKKIPLIRGIVAFYLSLYDRLFCKIINQQDYCLINLIGTFRSDMYGNYIKYIYNKKIVSLHEVIPNLLNKQSIITPKWFNQLFSSNCDIIVHSNNTYEDIKCYKGLNPKNVHLIHFGLFESFKTITPDRTILKNLPKKYILFFGKILPYKGLDLLYSAVKWNKDLFKDIKFVVAGSGFVDCVDMIKQDQSFVCINRRVTNEELVALIQYSLFVVCPYRGISQSGIPQTAFVFNKPIVASDLSAFKEVMTDRQNCLLFMSENSEDLAKKMNQMIGDYDKFVNRVKRFEENNPDFSWDSIAKQYEALIDS